MQRLVSRKTFRYDANQDLIGLGAYGAVYNGDFDSSRSWEDNSHYQKVAIKRVELRKNNTNDLQGDREVSALAKLRHPNIVTLYAVEVDHYFRYFVFELCEANLNQWIRKEYNGGMPSEMDGLYQMASGIQFIHQEKIIHRDIKPDNVLISQKINGWVHLKICDFGFAKPLNENGIEYYLASGLKGTDDYLAPELLRIRDGAPSNSCEHFSCEKCTTATDVFAAGCTFFRYLTKGLHPFGPKIFIQENIVKGNPVNVRTGIADWAPSIVSELIIQMIDKDYNMRPTFSNIVNILEPHQSDCSRTNIRSLERKLQDSVPQVIVVQNESFTTSTNFSTRSFRIDENNEIGRGGYATVFGGTFKGKKVAIKRIALTHMPSNDKDRECATHKQLQHPNVLQLLHVEDDGNFRYLVLELCSATLTQYCEHRDYLTSGRLHPDLVVLYQISVGLHYIHSKHIVHRDVKPDNILLSLTNPVQIKISDFGLCKKVTPRGTFSQSAFKGTLNWMAPELLQIVNEQYGNCNSYYLPRGTIESDTFAAGCVFFYFLTRGLHPFGRLPTLVPANICNVNPVMLNAKIKDSDDDQHCKSLFELIGKMIKNREKRIALSSVVQQLTALMSSNDPERQLKLTELQYDDENILSSTQFSSVHSISDFQGKALAVKKVVKKYCRKFSSNSFESLKDPNIIHMLHTDKDANYEYFGMELCVASLDHFFRPERDPKKYTGLMPSVEGFLSQLISGLNYIHNEGLVHGSIKPSNILISSSVDPQIKLSDFGLTKSQWKNEASSCSPRDFHSLRYWLAPEIIGAPKDGSDNETDNFTKESDIFATGSVIFYFISKGSHLFGDQISTILPNTLNGIQENLLKKQLNSRKGLGLVQWMTTKEPKQRPTLKQVTEHVKLLQPLPDDKLETIGSIRYSVPHFIQQGGQGSVFYGLIKGSKVAVKRMTIDTLSDEKRKIVYRELEAYKKLNHTNVVKFIDSAQTVTFLVLALELCTVSLDGYCRQPLLYQGIVPMPSDQEVLLQMAHGLQYIHSQELIHRDVKPENILISYTNDDNPAVIKWADFGMSRSVTTGSRSFTWSKLKGTERWLAPELMDAAETDKVKGSINCDTFALGCVFFFFLVPAIHPFGDSKSETKANIKAGNAVNIICLSNDHFAFKIITGMIENDKTKRTKLSEVIKTLDPTNVPVSMPSPRKKIRKESE